MAIDPSIPLQTKVIDPSRGIGQLANAIQFKKQFEAQKETRDKQNRVLDQKIEAGDKSAIAHNLAVDALALRPLLASGDIPAAKKLLNTRLERINQDIKAGKKTDTFDTQGFSELLDKDPQQALQQIDGVLEGLTRQGVISSITDARGGSTVKAFAPVVLKNVQTGEKMLVSPTVDNKTGEAILSPFDVPDGFEVSLETPEEKRAADVLANLEKATGKLQAELETKPQIAAETAAAEDAVAKADLLFDTVEKININIANLREAKDALLSGAGTGPIERLWPSFRAASVRLDNVQGRLGLDIIQATTFGALSKGELDLSKNVALPTGLPEEELAQWIDRRIAAQEAKEEYITRQAVFLSQKGEDGKQNTRADWERAEKAALDAALEAFNVTEDDIKETMRANGMDRSQVLREIRRRFESGGA